MLKDMTDSKRIDGHVQSQKAVGPFCFISYNRSEQAYEILVYRTPYHYITAFLANARVERHRDAWTIPNVGLPFDTGIQFSNFKQAPRSIC